MREVRTAQAFSYIMGTDKFIRHDGHVFQQTLPEELENVLSKDIYFYVCYVNMCYILIHLRAIKYTSAQNGVQP